LSPVAPIALLLRLPASSRSSVLARLTTGPSFLDRPLAPAGARTAHVVVGGVEHRVPVRGGCSLFCAWDIVLDDVHRRWEELRVARFS
jgi:hypothetical protein